MEQFIVGGNSAAALNTGAIKPNYMSGENGWGTLGAETEYYQLIAADGTISSFKVKVTAAPGAGNSWTFTLYVNGNPTTLVVTIADAATSGEDIVHSVNVVSGDYVYISCTPSGPPNAAKALWSVKYTGGTANQSLILGHGGDPYTFMSGYCAVTQSGPNMSSTELYTLSIAPTSGKLKRLFVKLISGAAATFTVTLRVNGVSKTLTTTVTNPATTNNDVAHEVAIAAGDRLALYYTSDVKITFAWGMVFEADIDSESLVMSGGDTGYPSTDVAKYQLPQDATAGAWKATETDCHQLVQVATFKKFFVYVKTAPGVGESVTFTVLKNSVATALTVTISGANQTGSDTVNTVAFAAGDEISLKGVGTLAHVADRIAWGLVSYTGAAPPVANSGAGAWSQGATALLL